MFRFTAHHTTDAIVLFSGHTEIIANQELYSNTVSEKMNQLIIILSLIAALMQQSDGYSSGAPPEACSSLQPNHDGASSQPAETNPYELDIEEFLTPSGVLQYVPGVTYTGINIIIIIIGTLNVAMQNNFTTHTQ